MAIAILATGSELIHGDTLNTNAHNIAHSLNSEGLVIGLHLTCGDDEQEMMRCLAFLAAEHNTIIVLGGLGPTSDDRTRFAVADYFNLKLEESKDALEHIRSCVSRAPKNSSVTLSDGNRQQALFPKDTVLLPNPHGSAMGGYFYHDKHLIILLPGPPVECLPMFEHHVVPVLRSQAHQNTVLLKWFLFSVQESKIAEILDKSLMHISCETGYRLDVPYLEFKVRCREDLCNEVTRIIEPLVAPYILTAVNGKASQHLKEHIQTVNLPIEIIDEATGGALQYFIQSPSNYPNLSFCKRADAVIRIHLSGPSNYWNPPADDAHLVISYQSTKSKGEEQHLILPHRWMKEHLAEWSSFRLLHLIN